LENGTFQSKSLLDRPEISVAESFITNGTEVPLHRHNESLEIIVVLEGNLVIDFGFKKRILSNGDYIIIDKVIVT
jgi:quercetin dioxygenase-like cupin family protein